MSSDTIVVTGTAGFIGFHLAEKLLHAGKQVIGIDCVSDYYDVILKEARLDRLKQHPGFVERRINLEDETAVEQTFKDHRPEACVNLAAQAGVRYSIENPRAYMRANMDGFLNILEACRAFPVKHLVYASTSSVYGANTAMPFEADGPTEHPLTLYAATKKSNEMMAHAYANLFGIPSTGMRFFTVYGPWGRPDMALFLFTKAIIEGKPINVFNNGNMKRDFTYVADIVEGISKLIDVPAIIDPAWNSDKPNADTSGVAPYRVVNIGNSRCEKLTRYIEVLEDKLGKKAEWNMLPMQDGDVPATWANTDTLSKLTGYAPETPIETGIGNFVDWYLDFYNIKR